MQLHSVVALPLEKELLVHMEYEAVLQVLSVMNLHCTECSRIHCIVSYYVDWYVHTLCHVQCWHVHVNADSFATYHLRVSQFITTQVVHTQIHMVSRGTVTFETFCSRHH
jgi:hypothetical protein